MKNKGRFAVVTAFLLALLLAAGCAAPQQNKPAAPGNGTEESRPAASSSEAPEQALELLQRVTPITDFEFTYAEKFFNGYAFVIKDGFCGYIDTDGNFIGLYPEEGANLDALFPGRKAGDYYLVASREGYVPYCQSGMWGYYDLKSNSVVVEPKYGTPVPFGYPVMEPLDMGGSRRDDYYYLDPSGDRIDPAGMDELGIHFATIESPRLGLSYVTDRSGYRAIVDVFGTGKGAIIEGDALAGVGVNGGTETPFPPYFQSVGTNLRFRTGRYDPIVIEGGDLFSPVHTVYDPSGQKLFEIKGMDYLGAFHHGRGFYRPMGAELYGVMDQEGSKITEPLFSNTWVYHNEAAWVKLPDNSYRMIDRDGRFISPAYESFSRVIIGKEALSGACRDGVNVIVSQNGEEWFPEKYASSGQLIPWWMGGTSAGKEYTHENTVLFIEDGKLGVMELDDRDREHVILPAECDGFYRMSDNGIVMLRKDGLYGFLKENACFDILSQDDVNAIAGDYDILE